MHIPKTLIAIAVSDRKLLDEAIFLVRAVESFSLPISITKDSASRIAAYCETIPRNPVTAATPITRYPAASLAVASVPCAARTNIAVSTKAGAICATIICIRFSFQSCNRNFSSIFHFLQSCSPVPKRALLSEHNTHVFVRADQRDTRFEPATLGSVRTQGPGPRRRLSRSSWHRRSDSKRGCFLFQTNEET